MGIKQPSPSAGYPINSHLRTDPFRDSAQHLAGSLDRPIPCFAPPAPALILTPSPRASFGTTSPHILLLHFCTRAEITASPAHPLGGGACGRFHPAALDISSYKSNQIGGLPASPVRCRRLLSSSFDSGFGGFFLQCNTYATTAKA